MTSTGKDHDWPISRSELKLQDDYRKLSDHAHELERLIKRLAEMNPLHVLIEPNNEITECHFCDGNRVADDFFHDTDCAWVEATELLGTPVIERPSNSRPDLARDNGLADGWTDRRRGVESNWARRGTYDHDADVNAYRLGYNQGWHESDVSLDGRTDHELGRYPH